MKERLLSYIVVRGDLSPSQQIVQACHAAMEMGISMWGNGQHTIGPIHIALLSIENQEGLMKIVKNLERDNVHYELFEEPDDNLGYTALCTYPVEQRNNALSKLPLL